MKFVEREFEKQKGQKNILMKLLEEKKGLRSAVNASIHALVQVICTNMDIEEYIAKYEEPPVKRHGSSDKENV